MDLTQRPRRQAPEKRVQGQIVKALRTLGFWVNNLSQPRASMQTPGLPDLFVWHARLGVSLWIEVKAPRGRPTTEQLVWHREARRAGQNVVVAHGISDVLEELRRLGVPIS